MLLIIGGLKLFIYLYYDKVKYHLNEFEYEFKMYLKEGRIENDIYIAVTWGFLPLVLIIILIILFKT